MQLKSFVSIFLFFLSLTASSQTYIANYKCYYGKGVTVSDLLKTTLEIDSSHLFTVGLVIHYSIKTDGRYMVVEGQTDSFSTGPLSVNFTQTQAIFDLKNKLVYFPDNKQILKLKEYGLNAINKSDNTCELYSIIGFDSAFKILACDTLPDYISPGVRFHNFQKGIKSIITPTFTIILSEHQTSNETLDFKELFKPYLKKELNKEYKFFE